MNKRAKVTLFAIVLIAAVLFLRSICNATSFYVDAVKGNDLNSGTRQLPFKTISKGLTMARASDTILIHSGTYREKIILFRSGNNTQEMISIQPVSGATVDIKGSDIVKDWQHHNKSIWKQINWTINTQQVFVDGKPLQQIGDNCKFNTLYWGSALILPVVGKGLSDMSEESFFYDQNMEILYVYLPKGENPNNHVIEVSVRDVIISSPGINFIELHNLNFFHSNVSSTLYMMGMVNIEGKSWLVADCTFTYGDFVGLNITGEGHRIINNICNYNGNLGISVNGSDAAHNWGLYQDRPPQDIVLDGNETSFNNYRGFYYYFQAGGIKASNYCNGVSVFRHTAKSNNGPGVWFDLYCRNIYIDRCLLQNNTRGIEYEISGKALISNNLVTGNTSQGIYISASDDVSVFNNTVVQNGFGIVLHGMPRSEHLSLKNNKVRNNIISESKNEDLVIYYNKKTATGNTSDYNLFFRRDKKLRISWTNSASYSGRVNFFKPFANVQNQDKHSFFGDPHWKDTSSGDYSLLPESPAIDSGTNEVDGIGEKDYRNRDRKLDGKNTGKTIIDIGAFEFSPLAPSTMLHLKATE